MLAKYFGKDETPETMNNKLKEAQGFVVNGGNYIWGAVTKVYKDITEAKTETPLPLIDEQFNSIKNSLDDGFPVMLQIDYNPKTNEPDMHFVLAVGYNPADENDLTIVDTLGGFERSLKDYLGWFKPSARKAIDRIVLYKGKKPAIPVEMIPISKDHFELFTRNHDNWHKTINYLLPGNDPNTTTFEEIQRVIAGYKSAQTDLNNRLNSKQEELDKANAEIANRVEQVGRLETQVLQTEKDKNAEIDGLNKIVKNLKDMEGQWEGRIKDAEGKFDQAMKDKGKLNIEVASLKSQLTACQSGTPDEKEITKLIKLLKKIFRIK